VDPAYPAGVVREQFVLNIDFAPTFVDLAGGRVPEFVDGRSLLPLLRANAAPAGQWRQDALLEVTSADGQFTARGLRTHGLAYFDYGTGHIALYDLREDPYEVASIHESADPALIGSLASRLSVLAACAGPSCRN